MLDGANARVIGKDLLEQATNEEGIVTILKKLGWPVDPEFPFETQPEIAAGVKGGVDVKVQSLVPSGAEHEPLVVLAEFQGDYVRRDLRELLSSLQRAIRQEARFASRTGFGDAIFIVAKPGYEDVRFVLFEEQTRRLPRIRSFGWERGHIGRTVLTHNLDRLQWRQRDKWDRAWDVEELTDDFYKAFLSAHDRLIDLTRHPNGGKASQSYVQQLLNRLLFISFTERMGWLRTPDGDTDYLYAQWNRFQNRSNYDGVRTDLIPATFNGLLGLLFFDGLDNPKGITDGHRLFAILGHVPYLNGGLFSEDADLDVSGVEVKDEGFAEILAERTGLFRRFNFTVTESTPLDQEVAVDPEMLGKIFERLVIAQERHRTGTYYTPRPIVEFMVNEALKGYLVERGLTEDKAVLLVDEDRVEAETLSFRPSELQDTVDALGELKAVDPACGSGAYLLMLLQRLFELTDRLEVVQHKKRSDDPHHLYKTKLRLLERCIYGVDSSELAVRIAKLRLWLSLVVENRGIKPEPLPNFDFLIMCGDSLASPISPLQRPLGYPEKEIREYTALKHRYFHPGRGEPRPSREEMRAKRRAIASEYADIFGTSRLHSVANNPFEWEVDFAEVFAAAPASTALGGRLNLFTKSGTGQGEFAAAQREPGFDIILANPPYINAREILLAHGSAYKEALIDAYPKTGSGSADLLIYFIDRALHLLRPGGQLAFITSNKWLRSAYGKGTRSRIANEAAVKYLIDFKDLPVFEGTNAYPLITLLEKSQKGTDPNYCVVSSLEAPYPDVARLLSEAAPTTRESLSMRGGDWVFAPSVPDRRLSPGCQSLASWLGSQAYKGIETGLNRAFIIDEQTKQRLILEHPSSSSVIKPLLTPDEADDWVTKEPRSYLIYLTWNSNIEEFPSINAHLTQWRKDLENRPDVKAGKYAWWCLRRYGGTNSAFYGRRKIVFPDISIKARFTLDNIGNIPLNTLYFLPTDDRYLMAVLNSRSALEIYRSISNQIRGGFLRFIRMYVESIPIPPASDRDRQALEELAHQRAVETGAAAKATEEKIDARVEFLYYHAGEAADYDEWLAIKSAEQGTAIGAARNIIALGENSRVEFKETLDAGGTTPEHKAAVFASAMKTVCAFINSKGGTLLIGVHDSGEIIGLERDGAIDTKGRDRFLQKIGNCLRDRFIPHPAGLVEIDFIEIDGKTIAKVTVEPTKGQQVLFDKKLYVRDLSATHELDPATLSFRLNRESDLP